MSTRRKRSSRHVFHPALDFLETRRLLALSVSLGTNIVDIVGQDASPGPDGTEDIDLHLENLNINASGISAILIQGPSGFRWAYGTPGVDDVNETLNGVDFSGAASQSSILRLQRTIVVVISTSTRSSKEI